MTLNCLPLGKSGQVAEISAQDKDRRRLMDLGFTPGVRVTPVLTAPTSSPIAYLIRGAVIALRRDDAAKIRIK